MCIILGNKKQKKKREHNKNQTKQIISIIEKKTENRTAFSIEKFIKFYVKQNNLKIV